MNKHTEVGEKKALLKALQGDIEIFGAAGDDLARITKLKREIKELENENKTTHRGRGVQKRS